MMSVEKKRVAEANSPIAKEYYITLNDRIKGTQAGDVLNHLLHNDGITSMESFQEYGITRLSARVFELKDMGVEITSAPIKHKAKNGRTCTFAKYSLKGEQ